MRPLRLGAGSGDGRTLRAPNASSAPPAIRAARRNRGQATRLRVTILISCRSPRRGAAGRAAAQSRHPPEIIVRIPRRRQYSDAIAAGHEALIERIGQRPVDGIPGAGVLDLGAAETLLEAIYAPEALSHVRVL